MKQIDTTKLRGETVEEIKSLLPSLSNEQLADVLGAEQNDDSPRKTLIAAIEAEQASRDPTPEARELAPGSPATALLWQAPDYSGSLTIDQSEWRHKHIKPASVTGTK